MRRCRIRRDRAAVRRLWAGGRPRREADPDVVVAKPLGGAAALWRVISGVNLFWPQGCYWKNFCRIAGGRRRVMAFGVTALDV